jgi:hypothetical protein
LTLAGWLIAKTGESKTKSTDTSLR